MFNEEIAKQTPPISRHLINDYFDSGYILQKLKRVSVV